MLQSIGNSISHLYNMATEQVSNVATSLYSASPATTTVTSQVGEQFSGMWRTATVDDSYLNQATPWLGGLLLSAVMVFTATRAMSALNSASNNVLTTLDAVKRAASAVGDAEAVEGGAARQVGIAAESVQAAADSVDPAAKSVDLAAQRVGDTSGEVRECAREIRQLTGELRTLVQELQKPVVAINGALGFDDGNEAKAQQETRKTMRTLNGIMKATHKILRFFAGIFDTLGWPFRKISQALHRPNAAAAV